MDYGIDVSHFQTISDPNAVHANGISFAWCKASEAADWTDDTYAQKTGQLSGAGIVVGGYHFARPGTAAAQVDHFRAVAGAQLAARNLRPMLDMEDDAMRGTANDFVNAFYDRLAVPLVVYGNLDWWQSTTLNPAAWGERDILGMIARYNGDPGNPGWTYPRLAVHQHSSEGQVPGIPGKVDRDATIGEHTLAELTLT
ncbi:glycoside hydrolase family 25 protein [Sciscionella sediminilitoris]|uniref:glycoside hydrolase family 25 protein n=1 Tax=Sciscionella sediminilitoris TaxID=1445613 RepID=UPI0004DF2C8A|nr:glycoside hydrolase family 25 protein [Sciscionella sp. SE31]